MIETVGLIGDPVAHSISPAMQNVAFAYHNMEHRYVLWPTPAHELPQRIRVLREPHMLGANVTIPHKTAVIPLLDQIDPTAEAVGAANTIVRQADGQLYGLNTDVDGFLRALNTVQFDPEGTRVVVLGAGGAARAVVYGLLHRGVTALTVINRTLANAEQVLADMLATTSADPDLRALTPDDPAVADTIVEATLFVNATSIGLHGELPAIAEHLHNRLLVVDLIYRYTPLLERAMHIGASIQDGLEMLVQQGARAFEAWTGLTAPVDDMRAAAQQALKERT